MLRALTAFLVLLAMTGCSTQIGTFTMVSTHNAEISRIDLKKLDLARHTGESSRFWILFIPCGIDTTIEQAIDRALERGKGDFMLNARIYDNSWTCLLFTWESYTVRGEVGLSTKGGARDVVDRVEACPPAVAPAPAVPTVPLDQPSPPDDSTPSPHQQRVLEPPPQAAPPK
ncbi:MAG: hypothetical protein ACAI25_02510 [Planctomycetota bacterium]